jgi:hypothetical protein
MHPVRIGLSSLSDILLWIELLFMKKILQQVLLAKEQGLKFLQFGTLL